MTSISSVSAIAPPERAEPKSAAAANEAVNLAASVSNPAPASAAPAPTNPVPLRPLAQLTGKSPSLRPHGQQRAHTRYATNGKPTTAAGAGSTSVGSGTTSLSAGTASGTGTGGSAGWSA